MRDIYRPDVSWVKSVLGSFDPDDSLGDVFILSDLLSNAFFDHSISFDVASKASYGQGVFRDRLSARTCLVGAEWHSWESESVMTIWVSKKLTPEITRTEDFRFRLEELISHEFTHGYQCLKSAVGHVGVSAYSDEDKYYSDPHEIAAISCEMEMQLLRIQPDVEKLLKMLRVGDRKLHKSDRYRLYVYSLKEEPLKFRRSYNKMMRALTERLTQGDDYVIKDFAGGC
jgi:hypothetical protein